MLARLKEITLATLSPNVAVTSPATLPPLNQLEFTCRSSTAIPSSKATKGRKGMGTSMEALGGEPSRLVVIKTSPSCEILTWMF